MSIKMNGKLIASNAIKPYESTLTYKEGDVVAKYNDVLDRLIYYKSKTNSNTNQDVTNTTYWEDLTDYELMNNSKALETGEPCYDKEILDDVINYKYSSFDESKFTKVGNPIITKDGILLNADGSNFLKIENLNINNKSIKIKCRIKTPPSSFTGSTNVYFSTYPSSQCIRFYWTSNNLCYFTLTKNNALTISTGGANTIDRDTVYDFILEITEDELSLSFAKLGESFTTKTTPNTQGFLQNATYWAMGIASYNTNNRMQAGEFDLKYLSVYYDSQEIFNGCKSGIDSLKENNFQTITTIYGYSYDGNIVYADSSSTPTTLYHQDGSYYNGTYFKIVNNAVKVPEVVTASGQTITIDGTTYYAYTKDSSTIYANSSSTPTALYNSDGTTYSGSEWQIISNKVNYLNSTAAAPNITITLNNTTVDAGVKITDDGIASGFSASHYITKTITDLDYSKDFDFISPVATLASNSSQKFFVLDGGTGGGGFRISQHVAQVKFSFKLNSSTTLTDYTILSGLVVGDKIQGRVKKVGTNLYLYARKNGGEWVGYANNPITSVTTLNATNIITMGWTGAGDAYCWDGSADLNTYQVFAQGDLVYQPMLKIPYTQSAEEYGSKIVDEHYRDRVIDAYEQGVENRYYTLQEDKKGNYTVVGTPTISGDFVASGFSSTSYISTNTILYQELNSFEFIGKFKTAGSISTKNIFAMNGSNNRAIELSMTAEGIKCGLSSNGTSYDINAESTMYPYSWSANTEYYVKLVFTGSAYILYLAKNTHDWTRMATINSTTKLHNAPICIGGDKSDIVYGPFNGSIDLKEFNILSNGKPIYQAVIPPNITLPMGEVYGAIQRNQDRIEKLENLELNEAGEKRLHAIKCYEDAGEILNDVEGYTDVQKMYHSTFDLSKFTTVGSPTITDDGIVTFPETSTNEYITISEQFKPGNKPWELYIKCKTGSTWNTAPTLFTSLGSSGNLAGIQFGIDVSHTKFVLAMNLDDTQTSFTNTFDATFAPALNTEYWFKLAFTGKAYQIWISNDKGKTYTLDNSLASSVAFAQNQVAPSCIGTGRAIYSAQKWFGTIDLKHFQIIVDGVPVFSGNKTGIDVIKPDDFTIVGTPTISLDNVLSNSGMDGYVTANNHIIYSSTSGDILKIKLHLKTSSVNLSLVPAGTDTRAIYWAQSSNRLTFNKNGYLVLEIGGNWLTSKGGNQNSFYNEYVEVEIICHGREQTLNVTLSDGRILTSSLTSETDYNFLDTDILKFGQGGLDTWGLIYGSMLDLNSFKVYINDKLIYQPSLKIPYTETTGGSKVTDIQYLDRVKDVYEQEYNDYKYFTIAKNSQKYTIPMGCIYDSLATDRKEINELKDLSNISQKGNDRLHALKSYAEEAEFLQDKEAFDDIYHYKYSSFDQSKFMVHGNLDITDDGIVGGFTTTSYISLDNFKIPANNKIDIIIKINVQALATTDPQRSVFAIRNADNTLLDLRMSPLGGPIVAVYADGATTRNNTYFTDDFIGTYFMKFVFDNGTLKVYKGNTLDTLSQLGNTVTDVYMNLDLDTFYIGTSLDHATFPFKGGSFDLKQFMVNVNDINVFNGQQEGIDILKDNNFTTLSYIYGYTHNENVIYSNVPNQSNPTALYDVNGMRYIEGIFVIAYNKVQYSEQATRGSDDIVISGVTYYEYEYNTINIYTDSTTNPTTLYNQDGTVYQGTQWIILGDIIYHLTEATYDASKNIWVQRLNNIVDAGVSITDDGIASGFSAQCYLVSPNFEITDGHSFTLDGQFNITAVTNQFQSIIEFYDVVNSVDKIQFGVDALAHKLMFRYPTSATTSSAAVTALGSIEYNKDYSYKLLYDGTTLSIYVDESLIYSVAVDNTYIDSTYSLSFGYDRYRQGQPLVYGSLDLNYVKLYVGGKLLYQPLLKIPYTQSAFRYGSKIVTGKYISRVLDAYEQNFEQKYYSLDEEEKKFALPLGELYGLIESKIPKSSLSEVICIVKNWTFENASAFCWDLSNGMRIQGATVANIGTNNNLAEYPLLKNFADTNYLIFKQGIGGNNNTGGIPYNSVIIYNKTKESFTTANHNTYEPYFSWIAIGQIDVWEA